MFGFRFAALIPTLFATRRRRSAEVTAHEPLLESRLLLSASHPAAIANVAGNWRLNDSPNLLLQLTQSEKHLSGKIIGSGIYAGIQFDVTGSIHGSKLKLKGDGTYKSDPSIMHAKTTLTTATHFEGTAKFNVTGAADAQGGFLGDQI